MDRRPRHGAIMARFPNPGTADAPPSRLKHRRTTMFPCPRAFHFMPKDRQPRHAADPRPAHPPADRLRGDGHGVRGAPGHRHGPARRHLDHPQEHVGRGAGRAGRQVKNFEAGIVREPFTVGLTPPSARCSSSPARQHLRRAGGRRWPAGRHRHHRDLRFEKKLDDPVCHIGERREAGHGPRRRQRRRSAGPLHHATGSRRCWWSTTNSALRGLITVKDFQKATTRAPQG